MTDVAEHVAVAHPDDLAALLDAVVAIGSDLDLRSVLRRITEASCAITGARYGFLAILNDDGTGILDYVTHGMSPAIAMHLSQLPQAVGLLGVITHSERPVRLADVADHPMAAGFPKNHPAMRTFLGVAVRIRGKVFGNLYLTEKRGGATFTAADEALVEALAGAAGFVIENARAYELSEVRRKWLEAAAAVSERLQSGEVDAALGLVVRSAREAGGGTFAALVVPSEDGTPEVLAADSIVDRDASEVLAEWIDAPDLASLDPADGMVVLPDGTRGTAALVPMRSQLGRSGLLLIRLPEGRGALQPGTSEMFTAFADQASLAFDRAQAVVDRQELMLVGERERIARDLHDVVIQRIFATGLQLQGMRPRILNPALDEQVEGVIADLDTTIKEIRTSIFDLTNRRRGGLRSDLADLATDYKVVLGFAPRVRTTGPVDSLVTGELAQQLLSVLREALSNVARHSGAASCDVRVVVDGDAVTLVVVDDGVGLPEQRRESGLRNARGRAEQLGGSLTLLERDGGGTRLRWCAPLPTAAS